MSRLIIASNYAPLDKIEEAKPIFEPLYYELLPSLDIRPGDFIKLTKYHERSLMVFDGKRFHSMPLPLEFSVIYDYPFNYFIQHVDKVPFRHDRYNLDIKYGNGYAFCQVGDIIILYILKNSKKVNLELLDFYYSYGGIILDENQEVEGIDLNQFLGKALFKII